MERKFNPTIDAFSFKRGLRNDFRIGNKFTAPLSNQSGYIMKITHIEGIETIYVCRDRKPKGITCKKCAEKSDCPLYKRSIKK